MLGEKKRETNDNGNHNHSRPCSKYRVHNRTTQYVLRSQRDSTVNTITQHK